MNAEISALILSHLEKYPLMTPQDVVKLLYQREFGCAHAVKNREAARAWLHDEYASVRQTDAELCEDLGNGYSRVYLNALDRHGLSTDELLDMFVASAVPVGDVSRFAKTVRELPCLGLPFDRAALSEFVEEYLASGCPAVHHSREYNEAYRPAYRVVRTDMLKNKGVI